MDISGLRILVLEDEAAISLFIEDILAEAGCKDIVMVAKIDEALAAVADARFDLAILDINVAGRPSFPVAEQLRADDTPFAFVSGYGAAGLNNASLKAPVLSKPFGSETLMDVVAAALSARPVKPASN